MADLFPVTEGVDAPEGVRAGSHLATVPPPTTTPKLGLPKPYDDDDAWGDDYRAAMDVLDAHPGIRAVTSVTQVATPFDGQLVYESGTARYLGYSTGIGWRETAGAGGGGGSAPAASQDNSYFGSLVAAAPGTTGIVVSLASPVGWRCWGFHATGTGDGHFRLLIGGSIVMSGYIHNLERNLRSFFGASRIITSGTIVTIEVTCDATGLTDYEATLIGEVRA